MKIISIRQLSYTYQGSHHKVLDDLTFDIENRQVISLLGPNGSGKSTLLQILAKLIKKFKGSITYNSEESESEKDFANYSLIGYMPQIEFINPMMTAFEYVLLGRSPYVSIGRQPKNIDREIAWNSINCLNAQQVAYERMGEISGGQLQLIRLARVISQQATLLLLDEPTTFLDLSNKRQLINIIRELPMKGMTVILATHDPDFIKDLNSEVVLLNNGKILAKGKQEEVLTKYQLEQLYGPSIQDNIRNEKQH
jgi:iron complex transport system ATP-binding protein